MIALGHPQCQTNIATGTRLLANAAICLSKITQSFAVIDVTYVATKKSKSKSFFGLAVLPTNYAGIALIALAIAMFIAEVKITSYGLLTIGGLISMVIGSLILFKSPHAFMRVSLPIVAAFTLSTLAIAIFLITIVAKSQRRKAVTGAEGMKGAVGQVQSWSGDHGKIFVHGEIWDASGPHDIARDTKVKVVESEGMELKIEIVQDEQ